MKLELDCIIFSLQKQGGISIYWKELIKRASSDQRFTTDVTIYSNNANANLKEIVGIEDNDHFRKVYFYSLLPINILRFIPYFKKTEHQKLFHSSYLGYILNRKIINIITVHDLGYERNISQKGFKRIINLIFKYFALKRVDGIICISEFTKKELLKFYPFCKRKYIKIIYNGVGDEFFPLEKGSKNDHNLPSSKYVLFVGTRFPYKNFDLVVNILEVMPDINLVLVGGGKLKAHEHKKMVSKIRNRFMHYESISAIKLNELYNRAHCLLYPSKYEGFGIPIVEAMKSGCPFIALQNASIPEIAQNAGIILPKDADIETFVVSIRQLDIQEKRSSIIHEGIKVSALYSWDKCYNETSSFYKEIMSVKQEK